MPCQSPIHSHIHTIIGRLCLAQGYNRPEGSGIWTKNPSVLGQPTTDWVTVIPGNDLGCLCYIFYLCTSLCIRICHVGTRGPYLPAAPCRFQHASRLHVSPCDSPHCGQVGKQAAGYRHCVNTPCGHGGEGSRQGNTVWHHWAAKASKSVGGTGWK